MMVSQLADPMRASRTGLQAPHHDGSDLCLLEAPEELGDEAVVRLRVPRASAAEAVALRYVVDGEPRITRAEIDEETETDTWWRATFRVANPSTRYRWLLAGAWGVSWLNGLGAVSHDVPDADDFVVTAGRPGPDWHLRSVVYEIFPDRFASSGLAVEPPPWALRRAWEDLPTGRGPETPFEWFGGDLLGIERRLDHIEALGASAIYLTPIFPAGSTHRYDASSLGRVDPLLGGDEALASLVRAAHDRGIRVIGDLTLNHVGEGHDWFRAAREGTAGPERSFFVFDDSLPAGYASWLGVPSLPKLDWRSPALRERMAGVVRHWLEQPYALDGWRIDVANMTGRLGDVDLNGEVASEMRAALEAASPDALLVAEHGHDFRPDLARGGWHGAMNYAGFLRPVWWWLRGDAFASDPFLDEVPAPRYDARELAATMQAFRAGVPWASVLHSWNVLDSHDTARFATVAGSRARHQVGLGLQMTAPGVPMIFAGDEIGLEGDWAEDARRTMPWDTPERWDRELHAEYRRLAALRRGSDALARGGTRFAFVGADAVAYLRETASERLLCLASRAAGEPVELPLGELGCRELEPLTGLDARVAGGRVALPGDGPAFGAWRLAD